MKNSFILLAGILLCSASCKKQIDKDLIKAKTQIEGVWKIDNITSHQTDTLGNLIKDLSVNNQGNVNFTLNTAGQDKVFHSADFEGPCATSELVNYFRSTACGDASGTGGWVLYWDADPNDLRLQIWGLNGGQTLHRIMNLAYEGNNLQLYYVLQTQGQNKRNFITWKLSKQ